MMVVLGGLMPCVVAFLNVLNDAAAMVIARGEPFVNLFDKPHWLRCFSGFTTTAF